MPEEPEVIALTRQWAGHIAFAVFLVDPDGNLLYYNDAAGTILGLRRQLQVTAFPLLGPDQGLLGATALFWESSRP